MRPRSSVQGGVGSRPQQMLAALTFSSLPPLSPSCTTEVLRVFSILPEAGDLGF